MSALKFTALVKNFSRFAVFQPRRANLVRQYATKIGEPKKKSSTLKLLTFGVGENISNKHSIKHENYPITGRCW